MRRPLSSSFTRSCLTLALLACDKQEATQAEAQAEVAASYTVSSEQLDLVAVAALIEREDVRDAATLEALINAEDSSVQLDVDADGKRDFVQVREVAATPKLAVEADAAVAVVADLEGAAVVDGKDGEQVRFELLAVPSSKTTELAVQTEIAADEVEVEAREGSRWTEQGAREEQWWWGQGAGEEQRREGQGEILI